MGFWQDRNVLVTGAGGFIGSHLTERLLSEGAAVRTLVRYNSRGDIGLLNQLPVESASKLEIVFGDLRDAQAVQRALEDIQIIFHLGAMISIPYSYKRPREVAESNFVGTLQVLISSLESSIERLVHTSSSEVYGTAVTVPINESHPLQGQSPYSASKIGADKMVESFHLTYDLPVVTIRPFNTYGPRQSARAVIPAIISQALTKETIHLGNLETTRDFTFVSDTVEGLLKAAITPEIEGQTFNLGSGDEVSIGDLAELIVRAIGRAVEIVQDPARLRPESSEVLRLVSDNSLAKQVLSWRPRVSFEDGLQQTIQWIRENSTFYRTGEYEV